MAAERGGPTTQSGILYQNSMTALFLGRLLDTKRRPRNQSVAEVRVETPDDVDDTVVTYADSHKAYIQAKENLADSGPVWKKLWHGFKAQFDRPSFTKGSSGDRLCLYVGAHLVPITRLRIICERARESASYEEWQNRLGNGVYKSLLQKIESINQLNLLDPTVCLTFFQHVDVVTWPIDHIEADLVPAWMPECNSSPITVFRLIRDRVGAKARIRGSFTAAELRNTLLSEEPTLQFINSPDIESLYQSFKRSSSLLRAHKHTISKARYHIPQPIVEELINWATRPDDVKNNIAMLIDQAGYGKSVVFRDVLVELEKQGLAVLGIKCDQQLTGVTSLAEIQKRLDIPFPVENCVESLAKLGRVVIILDQIDALSLTLAHDQRTLNEVLGLVARLRSIPNVRIVISCRLFDRNNDPRLRQIDAQVFRLPELQIEDVRCLLKDIGIEYDDLSKPTQELLTIPLHLSLFVQAVENSANPPSFLRSVSTLQDLYTLIWDNVIISQAPEAPAISSRLQVLKRLTGYMDREQEVSAPLVLFQQSEISTLKEAVNWLASAGIIIRGESGWTFIHQTFFDYCYARNFVEEGRDLVEVILASEQGLFERTKLLQVISYLRGIRPRQYIRTLYRILNTSGLRYHLKDLALRWLGSLPAPTDDEWTIVQQLLNDPQIRPVLVGSMHGNVGWFQKLRDTFLNRWLQNEQITDQMVMPYLASMTEGAQSEVIAILRNFLGKGERWNARVGIILLRVRYWESPESVELYERYFVQGPYERHLHELAYIAEADSTTGCRLIGFVLNNILDKYLAKRAHEIAELGESYVYTTSTSTLYGELTSFDHTHLDKAIQVVSEREPKLFLKTILPWWEKAMAAHGIPFNTPLRFPSDQLSIDRYSDTFVTINAIVNGTINALIKIAKINSSFSDEMSSRLSALPYETPQCILAKVYASEPELFATTAYKFLLADHRRFLLGTEQYDSRHLLRAIYPYLIEHQRSTLESHILSYAPIFRSVGTTGLQWRGLEQLYLLQAIPTHYLSDAALRRLGEWERKFPGEKASESPTSVRWGTVGSPIPQEITVKMSNRDWLRAMKKYRGNVEHPDFLKGGARELASLLIELVTKDPERFVSLFEKAPDDVDTAYIVAFLRGLANSNAPIDWLFIAIRRFAVRQGRDIRGSVTRLLAEKAKSNPIPNDMVEILIQWLNESSGEDEWWWSKGDNHGDVYQSYLNSVRGQAFNALMRIYDYQDTDAAREEKWKLIEFASLDSSSALRVGAIHELIFLIRLDRERAISLFDRLMSGQERLIESTYVGDFIYYGFYKNYLHFYPYISVMMEHEADSVKERGAQLACVADLSSKALESDVARTVAQELAHKSLQGEPAWRRGAALIYSHNIAGLHSETCMRSLISLLKDDDEQVLRHINSVFSRVNEAHFLPLREFFEAYTGVVRLIEHDYSEYLFKYGLVDPKWTLLTVQAYVRRVRHEDKYHYIHIGVEELLRLVLQIYTHPIANKELQREAMDVFDLLMEGYAAEAQSILKEWDSR